MIELNEDRVQNNLSMGRTLGVEQSDLDQLQPPPLPGARGKAYLSRLPKTLQVAFAGSLRASAAPGGGEVQMQKTRQALGSYKVDARYWRPWEMNWEEIHCLHLFGSEPEHLSIVQAARSHRVPVVLSSIAWFDAANCWREPDPLWKRSWNSAKFATRQLAPWLPSWRRELYHSVDKILPNSHAEGEQLVRLFGIPSEKIHLVPNGADSRFARPSSSWPELEELGPFVLYAGRIEPRKNQWTFLRAMQGTEVPIVVLGDPVPGQEAYYRACREIAGPEVTFLPRCDHEDPRLESIYANCGCLALCSWFETPGLVALEAGMSGVPLVLPQGGCTHEYFGDFAKYVPPHQPTAIREAVLQALKEPRNSLLASMVQQQYDWSTVARLTREAYVSVL
ncbi:Glycosyltransferase involved in cell wall bisynthesis [Planctomycetales bacterium 10988]|nr:Glycosyltransferase involved in cell wall bisynthesis [Planctomycetales bacterium 10988]